MVSMRAWPEPIEGVACSTQRLQHQPSDTESNELESESGRDCKERSELQLVDNTPPLTVNRFGAMPDVSGSQPHSSPCEALVAGQLQATPEGDEHKADASRCDPLHSAADQTEMPTESTDSYEGQVHGAAGDLQKINGIYLEACEAASQGDTDCLAQLIQNGCSRDQMQAACCAAAKAGRVHVLRFLADAFAHFQDCLTQVISQHCSHCCL